MDLLPQFTPPIVQILPGWLLASLKLEALVVLTCIAVNLVAGTSAVSRKTKMMVYRGEMQAYELLPVVCSEIRKV